MRESPNFLRYPRVRPDCEQRFRTGVGLASRGIFCSFITAASTSSIVDLGLFMIFFHSSRRALYSTSMSLRLSFFTTLLIFAIKDSRFQISDFRFQIPNRHLEFG